MAVDTLGCGEYEVYFKIRGGDSFVCRAQNMISLTWGRKLNAVSEAQVLFGLRGTDGDCCSCVSQINPWQHEMAIYRDGIEVWCGPITGGEVDEDSQTATFDAKDLSVWLSKRWIELTEDKEFEEADIVEVYNWLITQAYYQEQWNMDWVFNTDHLGIPIDREYTAYSTSVDRWGGSYLNVENELSGLRKSGIDFTVIRRTYLAGDLETQQGINGRLTDKHWDTAPKITIIGSGMGTEIGVGGGVGGYYGWDNDQMWIERPNDVYRNQFGLLQYFESAPELDEEETIGTPNAIAQRAFGLRELKKRPFEYVNSGSLSQGAPVTFDDLIPGRYFAIELNQTCRNIQGNYLLTGVSVSHGAERETVSVEMVPPGVEELKG